MVQNINYQLSRYLNNYYQNKQIGYYKFNYIFNNDLLIVTTKSISHTETLIFHYYNFQWIQINNFII